MSKGLCGFIRAVEVGSNKTRSPCTALGLRLLASGPLSHPACVRDPRAVTVPRPFGNTGTALTA